ncbi:MAG: alpha/beta fold hydrolase [Candidatus Hydrogenedens sp.]|nr:alpha/beta fold hydrolase [Candidatus Hydrogenedens sp.]
MSALGVLLLGVCLAVPAAAGDRLSEVRAHFIEVSGPIPEAAPGAPAFEVVETTDTPRYERRKLLVEVEPGDRLPVILLVPKGLSAPAPAMLCLHPTNKHGKLVVLGEGEEPNRNYAQEMAERGSVTLAPDYPGFGEYHPDVYAMGYASATAKGIFNHKRCVDLLASLPEVDGKRIGCIGHSLGGHNTLFAGLFDERIRVMVSSCGFNRFAKYYGGDLTGWSHQGYMPRIAEVYGKDPARMPWDFPDLLAALAPRAVFVNAPLHDANFEVSGVRECIDFAAPVYAEADASNRLVAVFPDCGHDFPPEAREAAYAFVDSVLKP